MSSWLGRDDLILAGLSFEVCASLPAIADMPAATLMGRVAAGFTK
jgi:hypothetical protein